jgi:hypothetical protein
MASQVCIAMLDEIKSSKYCPTQQNFDLQLLSDWFQSQFKPGAQGALETAENKSDKKHFNHQYEYLVQ